MPLIDCTLIKGYDAVTRRLLSERLTDAACSAIGADPNLVTVTIAEVAPDNYMRGRQHRTPASAPEQPEQIVHRYLKAMEDRNLEAATLFLSDTFEIICPGNQRFKTPAEFSKWAQSRYRSISKTFLSTDVSFHGRDATVFCNGTLSGVWHDSTDFADIRFVDRFVLTAGIITSQQIWNDMPMTVTGS
ncbi:MAG: tautomerase family protein [Paracoccaceae bacterium]|jgi:phenylpyruvate tautomerase PptA (4-oxalocrotonate tautomerase family)|tara:strand:+ start:227 stop:790 length:564 start_codon:yes stop_codon:yes gene_type:complete